MFRSVVVVVFQSAFHAEMHQNDRDQYIKTIQNIQKKNLIFSKKKFLIFFGKVSWPVFPNGLLINNDKHLNYNAF